MSETYTDPESGTTYRVRERSVIDVDKRTATHTRTVSTQRPGGLEVVHGTDVRIEVDRLVGRLPGDRCWERCVCPGGVHVEEDDE